MPSISKFIKDQLSVWPDAAANFRAMKQAQIREIQVFGIKCRVQHNPKRIISSTAETDPETISRRPCFLCPEHRPAEQFHFRFEGRKGRGYNVQVNPYPIFPGHLVIARDCHQPQCIWHHFPDMLDFARAYPAYTVFYNGPTSGASAPDHLHFQAAPRGMMPLEAAVDGFLDKTAGDCVPAEGLSGPLATVRDASLYHYRNFTRGVYALKAETAKSLAKLFYRLLDCCGPGSNGSEPPLNLFCWFSGGEYRALVVMRKSARSHHYYAEGAEHLFMSPGAADVCGMLVAPVKEDFDKLDGKMLEDMLSEVNIGAEEEDRIDWRLTRRERMIEVGILRADEIRFEIISDGAGPQLVRLRDGRIDYNGTLYDELYFDAPTPDSLFAEPSFILEDVLIGINFHWQQKRTLKFAGGLKFIVDGGELVAVNRIGMENYLMSVISSEMKSSSSLELLKAHAVISRSWLLTNLGRHGAYDVCADDHCQRYQGLTMAVGENVRRAIDETWGQVLTFDGKICDARYSKCCGGRTERFGACWEDVDYPYLTSVEDKAPGDDRHFCDCEDEDVLRQVLNDYDLEDKDFYRWKVRYSPQELSSLIARKGGVSVGLVHAMEPLLRGDSGRIYRLRIVGSEGEIVVGKELEIRRLLSETHLKSSDFDVSREGGDFVLEGRGWGHGVGLCQIGAAVMASRGFSYTDILFHYYKGAELTYHE